MKKSWLLFVLFSICHVYAGGGDVYKVTTKNEASSSLQIEYHLEGHDPEMVILEPGKEKTIETKWGFSDNDTPILPLDVKFFYTTSSSEKIPVENIKVVPNILSKDQTHIKLTVKFDFPVIWLDTLEHSDNFEQLSETAITHDNEETDSSCNVGLLVGAVGPGTTYIGHSVASGKVIKDGKEVTPALIGKIDKSATVILDHVVVSPK